MIEEINDVITMNFKDALSLATKAHEGQVRKYSGLPYIIHPLAVADKFEDENLKIIAILHDMDEDTKYKLDIVRDRYKIPYPIYVALKFLSHNSKDTYLKYILGIKTNDLAIKVKIEDIKHNLSDLKDGCLKDKYLMALYILEN